LEGTPNAATVAGVRTTFIVNPSAARTRSPWKYAHGAASGPAASRVIAVARIPAIACHPNRARAFVNAAVVGCIPTCRRCRYRLAHARPDSSLFHTSA